jgi:hypothetical protein
VHNQVLAVVARSHVGDVVLEIDRTAQVTFIGFLDF